MRRRWLLGAAGLAGCSVLQRPYVERRHWPLAARRPVALPARPEGGRGGGKVLLVRTVRAGPGLEEQGLRTVQPDGSVRADFYEQWAAPPAEAVEASLRRWLADSGLFAAVLAPGSRLTPELVLEAELDALAAEPGRMRIALGLVVAQQRGLATRALLQREITAGAPLADDRPADIARAGCEALARLLTEVEAALAPLA